MPAYAIIGAQWGDEGKGKVVDYLAGQSQWVVRYAGGNNAGHTVINDKGTFSLHLVPSGIFQPGVCCVVGNGVVVDPDVLLGEISELKSRNVDTSRIFLSDRAHLIMPYHIRLDQLEEDARGPKALGTTGKGVGPAYVDKTARMGIRVGDLLDLEGSLLPRLKQVLEAKNNLMTKVYHAESISLEKTFKKCAYWSQQLEPFIRSTEVVLQDALDREERILLEGAQGTLLDLDHGTYPFVTSSSASVGGASSGLGFGPRFIAGVIGVFKAYCTRVGSGPLPTEITNTVADTLREKAWEYGTTTGRARRIGWFDAVAGRYSQRINGFTSLILTRLDVLDDFPTVRICTGYQVNGRMLERFPSNITLLEQCQPIYEDMPGWKIPTAGATKMDQLPKEATAYIRRLEELIGCPFQLISTGPHREETIRLQPIM